MTKTWTKGQLIDFAIGELEGTDCVFLLEDAQPPERPCCESLHMNVRSLVNCLKALGVHSFNELETIKAACPICSERNEVLA